MLNLAKKEIINYIDKPMIINFPNDSNYEYNLYQLLTIKFFDTLDKIKINSIDDIVKVNSILRELRTIRFRCTNKENKEPIAAMPILLKRSGEILDRQLTDKEGYVYFKINSKSIKKSSENFIATIDLDDSFLFEYNSLPSAQTIIQLNKPILYIDVQKSNLKYSIDSEFIEAGIKEYFANMHDASFTDNMIESDVSVKLTISINNHNPEGKNIPYADIQIFKAISNLRLNILSTKLNKEIYANQISGIQGADFNSFEGAVENSLKKIMKKLKEEILPQLVN